MSKPQKAESKEFVPELNIDAAQPFTQTTKPPTQDFMEMMSTYFIAFSGIGISNSNMFINWIGWFILLSFYINRKRTSGSFSTIGVSLVIYTIMTLFGYYRISSGLGVRPK
ncbi:hypothetical protein M9Y10_021839 [Tritrichomonas musculus]|uniref:Uncharacterized protein n=1 Tax=Tritrichomonas musculus TaxID=1915356 RepID=A0ABR2KQT9_9EUKA